MKICVATFVDHRYAAYVDLFLMCMARSYPEYTVKIFTNTTMALTPWSESCFLDLPNLPWNAIAARFVLPPEHFADYDYTYITDIDMMIMREKPMLHEFHIDEMYQLGLSYSNSLRNFDHYMGAQSLSGLHFVGRDWWERVEPVAAEYRKLLQAGLVGLYREYDGVMLYRMVQRAGLKLPPKLRLWSRHHGIHLGNFRLFDDDEKLRKRIPPEFRRRWLEYMCDPNFASAVETAKKLDEGAKKNLEGLEAFLRRNP